MRKLCIVFALAAALAASSLAAFGLPQQTNDPGITANGVIGEVVAVDANSKQMFIKTDAGSVVIASVADSTRIVRIPPGQTTLDKAVTMTLAEVASGDRAFARGAVSEDRKTVAARAVIINTKADIAAKQEADRADWKKRGVVGTVSAIDPAAKQITLTTGRTAEGPQTATVAASGAAVKFRRYAPDSVKFADAKPSTFEELKVGDQLRAKGEKSEDGKHVVAEEVVSGSFRTILGTVSAIDPAKNEITVKSAQGGQDVTVVVSRDSMLKRFPDMSAMMGGGMGRPGGGPGGQRPEGAGGQRPAGAGGPGGGGRMMGGSPDMIQEMMERLPPTTVAEVKPGQMVVFSTTGVNPARVTAIQLIAGVEPLVAMMQARGVRITGGGGPGGVGGVGGGDLGGFGFGIGQP